MLVCDEINNELEVKNCGIWSWFFENTIEGLSSENREISQAPAKTVGKKVYC